MWSSSGQCLGQGEGEGARLGLFKATAGQGFQEAKGNSSCWSVQWAISPMEIPPGRKRCPGCNGIAFHASGTPQLKIALCCSLAP